MGYFRIFGAEMANLRVGRSRRIGGTSFPLLMHAGKAEVGPSHVLPSGHRTSFPEPPQLEQGNRTGPPTLAAGIGAEELCAPG